MERVAPGSARGPLAGCRVLDLTTVVSGPACTQYLGDLGAEVWKLEPPGGDPQRRTGGAVRAGITSFFTQLNRNKRSLVVDLQKPEGAALTRRLAQTCDVLVENFRPGVADRLGVGWETLRAHNPRLVYAAISGFGPTGPYAQLPAYDHIVQGLTGMMPVQGGDGPPRMLQSVVCDKATGLAAGAAIVAALLVRERTGRGQRIDVPMLEAYSAYMLPEALGPYAFPERDYVPNAGARVFRTWKTADGWAVGIVIQDVQWRALCRVIERPELAGDPRFATLEARFKNLDEMHAIMEAAFARLTTAELVARARREGAPFGPVNDMAAFLADPQVQHSGTVFELQDASGNTTRYLTHAARYSETPAAFHRDPPRLGENTDEILREAGLGAEEIADLRARNAVG
jgi:crotonobetainyl-CoA:carnitine CoA-transferase CaiB-like acyl-CoA transferase